MMGYTWELKSFVINHIVAISIDIWTDQCVIDVNYKYLDISMAPDSLYSTSYTNVADKSYLVTVPTNVLPNGLPFGAQMYRDVWVRI